MRGHCSGAAGRCQEHRDVVVRNANEAAEPVHRQSARVDEAAHGAGRCVQDFSSFIDRPELGDGSTNHRRHCFASDQLRTGIPGGHLVVLRAQLAPTASFALCSGLERGGPLSLFIAGWLEGLSAARSEMTLPSRKSSASALARGGLSCPLGETSRAGSRSIQVRRSSARTRVRRPRLTARNSPALMAS